MNKPCQHCDGKGYIVTELGRTPGYIHSMNTNCPKCNTPEMIAERLEYILVQAKIKEQKEELEKYISP